MSDNLKGFETTWQWAIECEGSSDILCGTYEDAYHAFPTCSASAATVTTAFQTTRSTTTAGRYTPPPSLDTSRFTVITSSYTTIITATAQSTTRTSTFESTTTSAIAQQVTESARSSGKAASGKAASGTVAGASSAGTSPPKSTSSAKAGAVTLTTGVLVAIIVGPILAIAICIGVFLFIRKRRAAKKNEALRLNSANYPPSNGPVGADQVYPYEVDVNQASGPPHHQFGYYGPKIDTYEVDAHSTMRKEKTPVMSGVAEMGRPYQEDLRSPAPTYTEALMPVEMDATPSLRSQTRQ